MSEEQGMECCRNCRFSYDVNDELSPHDLPLQCLRYPPKHYDYDLRVNDFPDVNEGTWCGEYKPKKS